MILAKKFKWPWGNIFNYEQLVSFITKIPALLECTFIFCSLLLSGFSPYVPHPLASLLSMTCTHACIAFAFPWQQPSSVMCYIHSSRGNDCTDYAHMTAAEYLSVSTYFHFLHTSRCVALAPSPEDSSWTHLSPLELLLRVQFPYVAFKHFSSWHPLGAWSWESNCAAPEKC